VKWLTVLAQFQQTREQFTGAIASRREVLEW
jgi:hypothetical protein